MAWIDQHCHIDPGPDGVAQVAEANAAGVMRMVSVGCDLEPVSYTHLEPTRPY